MSPQSRSHPHLLLLAILLLPVQVAAQTERCATPTAASGVQSNEFRMFRPGQFGVDSYYRDLEFAWDTLYSAKMGPQVRVSLTNLAQTLDISTGISPLAPGARGIELVHDFFRRGSGIDWTPNASQTPLKLANALGLAGGIADTALYTVEDRGHVDFYVTVPNRLGPDGENFGGRYPSFWTAPDEDVTSGYAVGTTRPGNSIFLDGPPVGQELDESGTGWTRPRTAFQTYFHHEFQHSLPPDQPVGNATELWSAAAEVVGGHFDKASPNEFPYNFPLLDEYQERTAFMAYVAYNFLNADTARSLTGMRDDLLYKWAKARGSSQGGHGLGLLATFLSDANCPTCASKQYFRPGGVPLANLDRVGVLLHNWRVAMFADNPTIDEKQYGFPAWSGFKPSENSRAWKSFAGTLPDDVDALPGVVTLTSSHLDAGLAIKHTRTLHGGTRLLAVSQLGANYWVIRAGSGLTSANRNLAVRVTPLSALNSDFVNESTVGGRLNISLIQYGHADTTAAEESILWQHPEWITGFTPIASVDVDTVSSEIEVILPSFGVTTKAAVLVMSVGDGRTHKWGNLLTDYTRDAVRYRLEFSFRQSTLPQVGARLFAVVDSARTTPSWAPEGDKLVFSAREPSGRMRLWRQSLAGGSPQAVNAQQIDQLYPDWSPRGDVIVYEGVPNPAVNTQTDLYLTPTQLFPGVNPPSALTNMPGCETMPAFQPNGQGIAYLHNDGPVWELRWIRVDGTGDKLLATIGTLGAGVNRPRWSADGSKVYVVLPSSGYRIASVPKDGGAFTIVPEYDLPVRGFDLHPGVGPLAVATTAPLPVTIPAGASAIVPGRIALYTPETAARDTVFRFNALGYSMDSPRYSPDGTRVAMHGSRIGGNPAMHWGRITENLPPVFGTLDDQSGEACVPLQFYLPATDPEGQALTYQVYSKPSGAIITQGNLFRWQSPVPGQYYIVCRALDPKGAVASRVVLITINDTGGCGDPLSGGAGGGGGGLRSREVGSTRSAGDPTVGSVPQHRNSFLDGAVAGEWVTRLGRLPGSIADIAGQYRVSLSSQAAGGVDIDRMDLVVVDHPPGTVVVADDDELIIGTLREAESVQDADNPSVTFAAGEPNVIESGTTLEISVAPDSAMRAIVARCELYGANSGGGIQVQAESGGAWVEQGTIYPRRAMDDLGLLVMRTGRVRLHIHQPIVLTSVSQLVASAAGAAASQTTRIPLAGLDDAAIPTELATVDGDGMHLDVGNSTVVQFNATSLPEGQERNFFLELVGRIGIEPALRSSQVLRDGAGAGQRFSLDPIQPNPSVSQAQLSFSLPRAAWVELEIFDLHGARVRTLVRGERAAGSHAVSWDGHTENGALAKVGTYFVRLRSGKDAAMKRFVFLR